MTRRQRPYSAPPRFQDLPGWKESFDEALRAQERMPAGHYVRYVGVQALRSVGNMVPPESITFVTTNFLLCMAIGVEHFRGEKSYQLEQERNLAGKVIDFKKASRALQLSTTERRAKYFGGEDPWDPAVWSRRGKPPYPVAKALSAARGEYLDEGGCDGG